MFVIVKIDVNDNLAEIVAVCNDMKDAVNKLHEETNLIKKESDRTEVLVQYDKVVHIINKESGWFSKSDMLTYVYQVIEVAGVHSEWAD